MTKNVKEGLGAWNVCPAPSTHSRREWESFCIFYFSRSHLHFPPAAHLSCTGAGRGEDPKAQRGVCHRRTGVNQPLVGKTPDRRGARGRELPEAPTSQFGFANLWIQKRRGLHAQICAAPPRSPVLFPWSLRVSESSCVWFSHSLPTFPWHLPFLPPDEDEAALFECVFIYTKWKEKGEERHYPVTPEGWEKSSIGRDENVSRGQHLLVRYDFRFQLQDLLIKFDFLASARFQKPEIKITRDRGEIKIKQHGGIFPSRLFPQIKLSWIFAQ